MERFVQCLSPVHIGTGRSIEPFEYIAAEGRYVRVHLERFFERLGEERAAALAEWVGAQSDQMDELQRQRRNARGGRGGEVHAEIARLRREFNLLHFARDDPGLRDALLGDEALAHYAGRTAMSRHLQVRELVKEADGRLLIPGSSLKGAIRTALAYLALEEMAPPERSELARELERVASRAEQERRRARRVPRRLQERIGQEIEKAVFRCGKKSGRSARYDDIHYDLMRAVSVSDSRQEQAELVVPQISTFVEGKTPEGRKSGRLQAQLDILVEAHAPGNTFCAEIRADGSLLCAIARAARTDEWIDFDLRIRRAFGQKVAELLPHGDSASVEQAILERIETACQAFARAEIEAERAWAEKFAAAEVERFYEKLGSLRDRIVPVRLGWGSQFAATTLLLALRADEAWRALLERCLRVFDAGLPPRRGKGGDWQQRRIDLDAFPTSRRLVSAGQKPAAPLGWIALAPAREDLPGRLVDVDEILRPAHQEQRRGRPSRPPAAPSPAEAAREDKKAAALMAQLKKQQRKAAPSGGGSVRPGGRVGATVVANDGRRVRVRLDSGEELSFDQPYYRFQPGERTKVKVDRVDAQGRVSRVRP